ncbi:hypothetical protein EV122DRAFT_295483 [Schizophyllum commune]
MLSCSHGTTLADPGDLSESPPSLHIPVMQGVHDDSDSEVDMGASDDLALEGQGSDDDLTVNIESHDESGESDEEEEEDDGDLDLMIAQVASPAWYRNGYDNFEDSTGDLVRAPGIAVWEFRVCPSEVGQDLPNLSRSARFPELVATIPLVCRPSTDVAGASMSFSSERKCFERAAGLQENHLLQGSDGNPGFPPADRNDLWLRYCLASDHSDISGIAVMCSPTRCQKGGWWDAIRRGQIRYCRRCKLWFHVFCLKEIGKQDDLAAYRDRIGQFDQDYLMPLMHRMPAPSTVYIPLVDTNTDLRTEIDLHDTAGALPSVETTWSELACLPLRRRTRPGVTPQTNEVLIQHAVEMVRSGEGASRVPDLQDVLIIDGLCVQASVRGAKSILLKDLRKLRGHRMRYFLCIGCDAQII